MLIQIFRWIGFIIKDYNKDLSERYYLTSYGKELLDFRGPIKKEEIKGKMKGIKKEGGIIK